MLSRLGEGALWIQGGKVRYYLVVILAIYSALLAYFVPTTLYSTQALMQLISKLISRVGLTLRSC
ncbi:MAG UNVERIFIED_CONTAM: hypothetical protein LVT10_01785 [Anaerolineae bacterium]